MSFVVQRFHPRIRPGLSLGSAGSKVAVHSQQGQWDSACALHCVAMALQISGFIADPSRIVKSRRRLEATLWRNAVPYFFKGTTFRELAVLIAALDCGVRTSVIERGSHREVIPFIERELARKRLVICSFRAIGGADCHAVLIAGAEGVQQVGRFEPHTFLILDPAEAPPASMATCNGRLHYAGVTPGRQRRYASYITASAAFSVVLNGAISLAKTEPQKPS